MKQHFQEKNNISKLHMEPNLIHEIQSNTKKYRIRKYIEIHDRNRPVSQLRFIRENNQRGQKQMDSRWRGLATCCDDRYSAGRQNIMTARTRT